MLYPRNVLTCSADEYFRKDTTVSVDRVHELQQFQEEWKG